MSGVLFDWTGGQREWTRKVGILGLITFCLAIRGRGKEGWGRNGLGRVD